DGPQQIAVAGPAPIGHRPRELAAQLFGHEGLGEEIEGAFLDRLYRVLDRAVRRHDQYRQTRLAGVRGARQGDAIDRVHAQVEERRVEATRAERRERRLGVYRRRDGEAHRREPHLQDLEDVRIVVD